MIDWISDGSKRVGNHVHESFHALALEGLLYRECWTVLDPSGSGRMCAYSEGQCYIPAATGPLTWQLESSSVDGERLTQLFSSNSANCKLYMTVVMLADPEQYKVVGPGNLPRNVKSLSVNLSNTPPFGKVYQVLLSSPSHGGGPTERLVVLGLQASDVLLSATVRQPGAHASVTLNGYGMPDTNVLPVVYTGDPGPGMIVQVVLLR